MKKIPVREPVYYREFHCTASECPYNCCRDWKIPNMRLRKDKTCPNLQKDGLCKLVCEHGEESLGHTCHTFPRENHIYADAFERSLSLSCPTAIELLWKQEHFDVIEELTADPVHDGMEITDENAQVPELRALRDFCMHAMERTDASVEEIFMAIHYILLQLAEDDTEHVDEDVLTEVLHAIREFLNTDREQSVDEWNEVFLDITDNYLQQGYYASLLNPLAREAKQVCDRWDDFRPVWKGMEARMRLLFAEEIYATMMMPEGDLYSMTMKWQWMAMTYICIRQAIYLDWCIRGEIGDKEILLDAMLVLRMMGYSEDDIEEYFESCFEEVIWDWKYMLFLMNPC